MAGVNLRFATISEAEILKIQEDAVPEKTKKATKVFPASRGLSRRGKMRGWRDQRLLYLLTNQITHQGF